MESNSLCLETILEKVSEIALQIQSGKFLDDILQWAIADTRALLDVDRVLIYRFLGDRDAVVAFESTQSHCPPVMGQLIYDPCFDAHWLRPYQQGQTTACDDIEGSDLSPCYVDLMRRLQVRANVVVPLWCQGTLWGLLIAHHCRGPRAWQPLEVQYIEQIALHLGTAIQQSRLQPPPVYAEQKQAEIALKESQQKFSTLISNLPGYVYRVHNDANYTPEFISQGVTAITGYQPEEYLVERSISCGQEIHPDDAERVWVTVQAAVGDRQAYECEYRIITKTGQQKWVWERGRGIYGEDGSLQWLEGFVTDISDRKQKDDLIRNIAQGVSAKTGDAFFHSLVHYLLQMLEMDHIFVSALIAPERSTLKVIAGLSRGQSLDGVEFSLAGTPCEHAIAQGFWICTEQIQQRFPHSAMLQCLGAESYAGIPLVSSDGGVIGVIGVLSNRAIANVEFIQEVLTIFAVRAASELERQQDEALLRRYERIVSATPDCVSLLDRDYRYQIINQTYLDWNQKSSDQIVGHSVAELLGQDFFENSAKPLLDRCLAGEAKLSVDSWLNYRDGQRRFARATYAPFIETDGTVSGVVINVHDLTELKRTEETLREQQQFTKQIAESSLALLYVYDLVGQRNVYANQQLETVLGYAPSEVQAMGDKLFAELIHPDDLPSVLASQQRLLTLHDHEFEEVEYRMRHKSGDYRWLLSRDCIFSRTETGAPLLSLGVATDITVLKETQIALRESEATNRAMISALPDLVLQIHRDGTYLQVHTSLGLGIRLLRPEQVQIGSHISTILPEKLAQERMTHVHRALSTRNLQIYEYLLPLDDETRYEEARIMPMDDDTALVVVRDITSRKIAEAVLYEQVDHERLLMAIAQRIRQTLDLDQILHTTVNEVRQFLRTDRVIIYRFDPDWSGTIIAESVGEGWNSILGMKVTDSYFSDTRGQAYQQGRINVINNIHTANLSPCHFDFLEQIQVQAKLVVPILQNSQLWGLLVAQHCRSPRQWELMEIDLQQQLATQIAIAIQQSELYHQVQTLNQELALQVQERTAQLEQALSFEALLKRITDRVRDSLDESQILQAAVEELAQGLQVAACDTGIYNAEQTTSTIAYEFTNTLQPAQGCTFEMVNAPHKEVYPYLLRGQPCQFCDMSLNPLRSDQRLLTILAVPIVDDQGVLGDLWLFKQPHEAFDQQEVRLVEQVANQCAIALRQSRLYQAAQSQVQELERLNQLKDDFLSTVSHELRSPISSITMVIHMLESSLAPLGVFADPTSPINRYFKVLREESQREADLINDLLDLARLDADTEPLNLTSIALQHYIPHLTEPFIERSRKQQQHFNIHIPEHLPPMTTDLFYLERVLTELFHNASKYTPAGETITVSALSVNDIFEIYVTNSGVEIPPAECDRIFDKFYRIPNNDPWKHGGTGLGLALVKKLIERLGGTIRVESHAQQTTFALQFKGGGRAE